MHVCFIKYSKLMKYSASYLVYKDNKEFIVFYDLVCKKIR